MGSISEFFGNLKTLVKAARLKPLDSDTKVSVGLMVQNNAAAFPDDYALICEDEYVTWKELNDRSNRIAQFLKSNGIDNGDCVSLVMQNRIEFLVTLIGIVKLGATAGLINTNLSKIPLVHCINLINSKKCILGEEQVETLAEVIDELSLATSKDYFHVRDTGKSPCPSWALALDSCDTSIDCANLPETAQVTCSETAYYVFTSGTTGLPKAAIVSHKRAMPMGQVSADLIQRLTRKDRLYNCLPLYHATGLNMGWQSTVHTGASMVIRRKLSVSAFWDDIRKYECTSFVYIGEFIRYLMSRPEQSNDADNPIVTSVGNGLRPDIWMDFKKRFNIERIGEFYGASEGNSGFVNALNKDCTVGMGVAPIVLASYDVANDKVLRDDKGMLIPVEPGEPGLLLIEITEKTNFEGYTSDEATNNKIFKNVLVEGDRYFNTGDLLKQIEVGFSFGLKHYQFVDRVGDTFRWKGENVSTNEIGEIINTHPDIHMSNIYGVEIPGTNGRAGMAALILREGLTGIDELNVADLSQHLTDNLPSYAQPIFLRLLKEQPTTTTMKLLKSDLREQAYHLDRTDDEILVLKPGESVYTPLDREFYELILAEKTGY